MAVSAVPSEGGRAADLPMLDLTALMIGRVVGLARAGFAPRVRRAGVDPAEKASPLVLKLG